MAERARDNVDTIVARLTAQGYRFHSNDGEQTDVAPRIPPTRGAHEHAEWLQSRFGPVPETVKSWIRLVGDVWLVGTHPDWPDAASADPLVLQVEGSHYPDDSIRDYFADEHEQWTEWAEAGAGPFVLPLSPDRLHKDNVSGGGPYGIALPGEGDEGTFVGETSMSFVSYLNQVFANGGFPYPTTPSGEQIKQSLAAGLLRL